jgi:hypothetical protein
MSIARAGALCDRARRGIVAAARAPAAPQRMRRRAALPGSSIPVVITIKSGFDGSMMRQTDQPVKMHTMVTNR